MKRSIFPFSVPQASPSEKLKNIKEEISRFQKDVDYSVSFDGKEYAILSDELKVCLRLKVWEKSFDEYKRSEHGGEYYDNSYFFYEEGKFDGDLDTFKIKNETDLSLIQEEDSPKIMEIDDEQAEKIHQENLKKEKDLKEDVEMTEFGNSAISNSEVDRRKDKKIKWKKTDDKKIVANQEITDGKDNSQGKSLSQKELDEKYKKVDGKKDLNKKQLEFIQANEKDIEKNKGVSSGVAIVVACGLAFVFTFGSIVWYRKKSSRK